MNLCKRRTLKKLTLGFVAAWSAPVLSVVPNASEMMRPPANSGDSLKPYDIITPPVQGDARLVREFFSYSCPHCRTYHNGLVQWGGTLPSPLQYVSMPIITDPDDDNQILAVYGRLICSELDPACLPDYDLSLFNRLQDGSGINANLDVSEILALLVRCGISAESIRSFLQGGEMERLQEQLMTHAQVIKTYSIKSTPSVGISGRFVVNPDQAQGNVQQFLVLLNGIVSRVIEVNRAV